MQSQVLIEDIQLGSNFNLATRLNLDQALDKHISKAQNHGKRNEGLQNFEYRVGHNIPEGAGKGAAIDCGIVLTGVESSRGIGEIFNFPGALLSFALIAYRLFWNQFQT